MKRSVSRQVFEAFGLAAMGFVFAVGSACTPPLGDRDGGPGGGGNGGAGNPGGSGGSGAGPGGGPDGGPQPSDAGGAGGSGNGGGSGAGPGGAGGAGGGGGPGGAGGMPGSRDGLAGHGDNGECDMGTDDLEKCPCSEKGAVQECWPGIEGRAGVGPCKKGTQVCQGVTVLAWSRCTSYRVPGKVVCDPMMKVDNDCNMVLDCQDPLCEGFCMERCRCVPDVVRWCDTPNGCYWGKQMCLPDGQWGACIETAERPMGCSGRTYNPCCCQMAGGCCEGGLNGGKGPSVGKCDSIACPGSTEPPQVCPGMGACIPGKLRYCPFSMGGVSTPAWGNQVCSPEGGWGPCTQGSAPPGCTVTSYSSRALSTCCIQMGACCRIPPSFESMIPGCDASLGNCRGISCR